VKQIPEGTRAPEETLVVATTNAGKLEELRSLLAGLPLRVCSVAEVMRHPPRVVEDGATFAENSVKKARAVSEATRLLTLADDSGLEVDALGGRPGVRSARFAHERATDAENNAALLAVLGAIASSSPSRSVRFTARFRCVLALADPLGGDSQTHTAEGVCEGAITRTPVGAGGFGYDPLFVVTRPDELDKTMAELTDEEKNRISHRARAFAALRPLVEQVLAGRRGQAGAG
jgi:XTP/dITP diphosphohydrolase